MKPGEEYLWDFETTPIKVRVLEILNEEYFKGFVFESKDPIFPANTIEEFCINKKYWKRRGRPIL